MNKINLTSVGEREFLLLKDKCPNDYDFGAEIRKKMQESDQSRHESSYIYEDKYYLLRLYPNDADLGDYIRKILK